MKAHNNIMLTFKGSSGSDGYLGRRGLMGKAVCVVSAFIVNLNFIFIDNDTVCLATPFAARCTVSWTIITSALKT